MDYTFATVIVTSPNQSAMQTLVGDGYFTAGYSADGTAPATHYVSSGPFDNSVLNMIVNSDIPKQVNFGNEVWTDGLILVSEETLEV